MDRRATLLRIPRRDFNLAVHLRESTSCYAAASAQQINDQNH